MLPVTGDADEAERQSQLAYHYFLTDKHCSCPQPGKFHKQQQNTWRHPAEFSVGFSAGLFRGAGLYLFISLSCKYGGLSFTTAYAIVTAVLGLPTVILLAAIGQQSRCGPLGCWSFSPVVKGVGLSLLLIGALFMAPSLVVASEGVYLSIILLESQGSNTTIRAIDCGNAFLTGFCFEKVEKNITREECDTKKYTDVMEDWGICGQIDEQRRNYSTLKSKNNHFLWKRVAVFNAQKANRSFSGPKLPTTDLLAGKLRRGFRTFWKPTRNLHWTLLTFVFTLSYCGLLLTFMLEAQMLRSLLNSISLCCSACLALISLVSVCGLGSSHAFEAGWKRFGSSELNTALLVEPAIWADAVMLMLWNTGCCTGELIHLSRMNVFGQDFIFSCLLQLSAHCLVNWLHTICYSVTVAYVGSNNCLFEGDEDNVPWSNYGFTQILMEMQPWVLAKVEVGLSVVPMLCFAINELCASINFNCVCVDSVVEVWPCARRHRGCLHLVMFCLTMGLCLPLCVQFGGAVVYDYLHCAWGWNIPVIMAAQLLALWFYLHPTGVVILFKHLGSES